MKKDANLVANVVMSRFRLRGETGKNWAKVNGCYLDTVNKAIYGTRDKAKRGEPLRIKEGLLRDGSGRRNKTA